MNGKERFDLNHATMPKQIDIGNLVLLHDAKQEIDMSSAFKLAYRWLGPYRVTYADAVKGTYMLEELDGVAKKGTFAGHRLKKFI